MPIKVRNETPTNKYERVLVAAKEARRLNEWDATLIERPYRRLCEEAVTRVDRGAVKFTYDPASIAPAPPMVANPLLSTKPLSAAGDDDEDAEPEVAEE